MPRVAVQTPRTSRCSKGLEPVRERPGHVHRIDRAVRAPPPGLRGRRQLRRRGDGRLLHPHRRHAARRRRLPGRRQRPRHPGRPAPGVQGQVGGRDRPDHAARGRQVRRRGLQDLRRPARRRRLASSTRCRARLDLEIHRDGEHYAMAYANGGMPQGQLKESATPSKPDAARPSRSGRTRTIFEEIGVPRRRRCSSASRRWRSSTRASRSASATSARTRRWSQTFKYDGRHRRLRASTSTRRRSRCSTDVVSLRGIGADVRRSRSRCSGTPGYYEGIHSFANNIATTEGGMHEEGFKKALTNVRQQVRAGRRTCSRRRTRTSSARTSARD